MFPFTIFGFTIDGWVLFGFFAQFLFFLRTMVQWISSEAHRRSVIPVAYWYLSLLGSILVFIYAVGRRDIVITAGQFIAFSIYARNVFLYRKEKSAVADIVFEHESLQQQEGGLTKLEKGQATDFFSQDYRLQSLFSKVPATGGRLLDLGSGNGEIANFLRGRFSHFTLADVSVYLCENLRHKFSGRSDVSVVNIDAQTFSLPDALFDGITMTDIIEHIPDDCSALQHAFGALKPGGFLFVSVPALPLLYGLRDKEAGHYRRYIKKELLEKLTDAGFHIKSIFYWNILGVLPYLLSEKILEKPLAGPARRPKGFWTHVFNRIIYGLLLVELRIPFLPFGVTLIAIAEKPSHA